MTNTPASTVKRAMVICWSWVSSQNLLELCVSFHHICFCLLFKVNSNQSYKRKLITLRMQSHDFLWWICLVGYRCLQPHHNARTLFWGPLELCDKSSCPPSGIPSRRCGVAVCRNSSCQLVYPSISWNDNWITLVMMYRPFGWPLYRC